MKVNQSLGHRNLVGHGFPWLLVHSIGRSWKRLGVHCKRCGALVTPLFTVRLRRARWGAPVAGLQSRGTSPSAPRHLRECLAHARCSGRRGATTSACRACFAPVRDQAVCSVHALCGQGQVGGTKIEGNTSLGASLTATPPCPCRASFRWSEVGTAPRGEGQVCADGNAIVNWPLEVTPYRGPLCHLPSLSTSKAM